MNIQFVEFDRNFLDLSYKWLSDSEIREQTGTPFFSREDQEKWFLSLQTRSDYYVWGVLADNFPIGVVGIKKINYSEKHGEYFGYLGEKNYIGQGIGKIMIDYIKKIAMNFGLRELRLHVFSDNIRALKLYEKKGFKEIISNDNQYNGKELYLSLAL